MASKIFQLLEGRWNISRSIPQHGSMQGVATFFRKEENELIYEEVGEYIQTSGAHFAASQKYIYRLDNEAILVFLKDGKSLLHRLNFSKNCAQDQHICNLDTYNANYKLISNHAFSITYAVKGPNKDYLIHTLFNRILSEE